MYTYISIVNITNNRDIENRQMARRTKNVNVQRNTREYCSIVSYT